jgi:hypothetical protein
VFAWPTRDRGPRSVARHAQRRRHHY